MKALISTGDTEFLQRHLSAAADDRVNDHRNMVAQMSPISERPDFD